MSNNILSIEEGVAYFYFGIREGQKNLSGCILYLFYRRFLKKTCLATTAGLEGVFSLKIDKSTPFITERNCKNRTILGFSNFRRSLDIMLTNASIKKKKKIK